MAPLNRKKLLEVQAYLIKRGVKYGYGAKAEGGSDPRNNHRWNRDSTGKLSTPIESIKNIDCSGLVRYLVYIASDGDTRWPDGSQAQRDWCRTNLQRCDYADTEKRDNVLRVGFMTPGINGVGSIGHVWFTFNGNTLESYGGHGVGSHKASVYARVHSGCFVVPSVSGLSKLTVPVLGVPTTETPKPDAALILATKDAKGELAYHRLDGATLKDGAFTVDSTDVLAALAGGKRRVEIRAFLQSLGATVYDEGDYLSDPAEPRMYLFVDTK